MSVGASLKMYNDRYYTYQIRLHFVFCTRYRRKIFRNAAVRERCEFLIRETAANEGMHIVYLSCSEHKVHLTADCSPYHQPHQLQSTIKRTTSRHLRTEFAHLSGLSSIWTRECLVMSDGSWSREEACRFIYSRKTRG